MIFFVNQTNEPLPFKIGHFCEKLTDLVYYKCMDMKSILPRIAGQNQKLVSEKGSKKKSMET